MMTAEPLPGAIDGSKPKVLVVDDDETMRDFLSMGLKKLGYAVVTAPDGMAALNLCSEHRFDLVVCDIRMPKLSGPSFLKNARNRAPQSVKRVIFVSSLADANMRREVAEAGGAALLSKPLTMAQLQQAIASLPAQA